MELDEAIIELVRNLIFKKISNRHVGRGRQGAVLGNKGDVCPPVFWGKPHSFWGKPHKFNCRHVRREINVMFGLPVFWGKPHSFWGKPHSFWGKLHQHKHQWSKHILHICK